MAPPTDGYLDCKVRHKSKTSAWTLLEKQKQYSCVFAPDQQHCEDYATCSYVAMVRVDDDKCSDDDDDDDDDDLSSC